MLFPSIEASFFRAKKLSDYQFMFFVADLFSSSGLHLHDDRFQWAQ